MDNQGRRSRKQEILWHSPPASFGETLPYTVHVYSYWCVSPEIRGILVPCSNSFPTCYLVYKEPYLLVYCESALEVYDVLSTKWIQIIPFRKVRHNA